MAPTQHALPSPRYTGADGCGAPVRPVDPLPPGLLADLVDEPLLGLDAAGMLLSANRAALRLLESGDTLAPCGGRPCPVDPALRERWAAVLAEAAAGRRRLLRPSDPAARTLALQPGSVIVPVLVRVGSDRSGRLRTLWAWAHAVGLGAHETRAVETVLEGESPAEIGEHDGTTVEAVRGDLLAALAKAGVRGPHDLAVELARAPR
jgi:DNA-binding CsgD family transcriptional regulator